MTEVTAKLRSLLDDMDSDASDWIQSNNALLTAAYPNHFKAIEQALEIFDFDEAMAHLDLATSARANTA